MTKHKHLQQFTATSGNICQFTVTEKTVAGEIRIGVDAEWLDSPSDSDVREFYDYMRQLASKRGDIQDFCAADKDVVRDRLVQRFVETGDAGIPVKPVR